MNVVTAKNGAHTRTASAAATPATAGQGTAGLATGPAARSSTATPRTARSGPRAAGRGRDLSQQGARLVVEQAVRRQYPPRLAVVGGAVHLGGAAARRLDDGRASHQIPRVQHALPVQ